MSIIQIELPENLLASAQMEPTEFIKEMRIAAAVKWYEIGEISQNRAAEIAGLTRTEFIDALGRYRVSILQYTAEELQEELKKEAGE
jgi:predicted HTH domain antitoxin